MDPLYLNKLLPTLYLNKLLATQENVNECVEGFQRLGFPQRLGVIGKYHYIEVMPSARDAKAHLNEMDWYSIALLALVDYRATYGICLVLDGIIQCTTRDEFSYQEMISFLPLNSHPNPKRVLIVGGGDGGVAREVAKHPLVEEIHQVEIDERVVELSKKYLPTMACGFLSPKLKLTIGDGLDYMKKHNNEFDVIITDSSDPVGPAQCLFEEGYYKLMKNALRHGGIVCSQGGSFWLETEYVKDTMNGCRKHFPSVAYANTSVPSYPCGHIGFIIGCVDSNRNFKSPITTFTDAQLDTMNLKYYTADMHSAAFALPRWVESCLR